MPNTTQKRRNLVFKSLHKPLTYMGGGLHTFVTQQ